MDELLRSYDFVFALDLPGRAAVACLRSFCAGTAGWTCTFGILWVSSRTSGAGRYTARWLRSCLTYLKSPGILEAVPHTVRTSLDIPEDLHRRIHEAAKRRGCSARALILASIEREVGFESSARGRVKAPLVLGKGEPVDPSHDEIYEVLFS